VAKKGQKRSMTKKAAAKPAKAAGRPAARAAAGSTAKSKAPAAPKRSPASSPPLAPAPAGPTLGEQAERLRDEIQRSKLTHPDPWRYAPKARAWGERAQALVEQLAAGRQASGAQRDLEALARELQADRDFQEARRIF
jgi:hypothetical protein